MGIIKTGRDVGAGALNLIRAAGRAELTPGVSDKALPLVLPRARLSPDFIDQQADRVARQMIGEHVTSGKPKDTKSLAGRSMKESARVKKLDYKLSPVGTVAEEVQYTPRKGDVTVAFPGDQTVSNKLLEEVNGFPIDSVQEGGAYYGLGQKHLPEPEFWKSTVGPARNVQGKVDRVSELFEPERIIGSHLAMGPVANNFAMHFADANLRAIDWQNVNPKKLNVFDNIIAGGYKDPVTGERVRFPNWPGIADPEAALAAMKDDTALRKWFNNRMKTPKLTKPLGLPNGLDIQYAITEPRLRDMEINMTGLMTGELKPGALVEAAGNPHNTYSHRILGEAKGPQEVLTPFVVGFPDAAQHIATTQRPSDFTGTIQKVFPHQLVDDQYIDDVNRYRERIKKLTGQKDGGAVEASEEGGSADDFDARVGKLIDQHHFDNRLNDMIDQHMAGGGLAKGIKAGVKMLTSGNVLPAPEAAANLQKFLEPSKAPMRLYHGTTATEGGKGTEAIRRFKPSKDGALGSGTYLTPSPSYAGEYSFPKDISDVDRAAIQSKIDKGEIFRRSSGNILPVFVQMKNPLIIDGTHGDPMVEALTKLGMEEGKALRMVEKAYEEKGYIGKEVQSRARAQGYDGLMQYRDGELGEVVSYNPNAVKSAIGNQGTYDISQPDLSKAEGGVAHMGAGGKISKLMADILKSEGRYGAGRLERAADEIPNLEKMYQRDALMRAFSGDNAKALMTMNPKDFEKYAARLTVQNYPLKAPLKNDVPTKWNSTTEDYVRSLSGLPKGFNDVPFLMINKAEQGLPLVPFIAGHEGRHRNRALAGKGVQSGLIQLLPRSELREGFPRRSQQEYIEALKKELEMTGNKVVPEGYEDRSAILLPDIYADGGAVHMKEGRTARDFKPAETPEQEIMRYLRMLRVNAIGGVSQGGASVGGRLGVEIPVSENVSIEPYVQGFSGFGKPQGGGGANLKFRFSNGGGASGTNADILDVIAQSKAQTGPSTAALPRYGNMTPENQFEREFRARLVKEQAARENAVKRGFGTWVPEIPGFLGDLAVDLPYNIAQRAAGRRGDSIKPLGFGEDVRRVVGQTMGTAPDPLGETGMSAPPDKINEAVTDLLEMANPFNLAKVGSPFFALGAAASGAKQIGKGAVSGAKALTPTAAKLFEDYMMSTGMMLPVVKPKGGNWVTGSAEDSLKGLKRGQTATPQEVAEGRAYLDNARATWNPENQIEVDQMEREFALLRSNDALNNWVDRNLTRYVKNEMGASEDPVRLAADAFPAAKAKMLADKQKQIDKATADMEKARAERGFTPEMMTRSQARIRDLEKEKELIEYRTGLHYEPQRGSARAKEVREALGMPLDPVSTSPYGQAWENKSDTAISGLPYRLRLPMVTSDTAPDALRALGGEFAVKNPNALAYSVSPYVRLTNLGFDHIVDELSNAINPVSGLPKGLIVDPNDLSKWTVPQAVEHVDKINAWRAAQKAEADLDRANNVATVLHKDFPDKGMRWVELKIPEALPEGWSKSASGAYIDPQGGKTIYNPNRQSFLNSMKYEGEQMQHCVAGDRYCRAVELGDSRIFSLRDAKGKPHATIETQKNSLDQYLDKLPDKTYDQWIEEFKNLPEYNNADPLWRPGASPEWTKFLKENKGLNEIPDSIAQIKGPRDRTPKEEYFPYIQDFVKSGKWGNVEELFNAGLHKVGDNYLTQPEMDALIKANGGMKRGGAVRIDARESAVKRGKGGNVKKVVKSVGEYIDPVATKISDWEWRALQDVKKDVPITIVPDYVQAGYGQFIKEQAKKAAAGSLNDRDLMKAYLITQSSIGRGGLSHSTATKTGLKVPNAQEVRPEGAFATWLGSPAGQRYLDAAQKGEIDPKSLEDIRQKFAPFGKQNQLVDQMASAVKTIPSMTPELNLAISGNANDYRDFAERLKGIAAAKSGFIGSLLGRGDLPTFDARQIGLHTSGMPMPTASAGTILSRGKGMGGREAVDRLAARQKNMGLDIDPSLDPHYQHLTHHAIWDALGGEKTTHQDLIDAMKNYASGGVVKMDAGGLLEKELEDARRAATVNPLMARKFAAQRQNVTEPTSIMDERYPAWKKSQDEADLFLLGADMATSVAPFVSPLAKGAIATAKSAPEILARGLEKYMVRTGGILPMDVYHGSPHRFPPTAKNPLGEFDASKIGTGEGAQAYGHGHYLAEDPSVGAAYRRQLSGTVQRPDVEYKGKDYLSGHISGIEGQAVSTIADALAKDIPITEAIRQAREIAKARFARDVKQVRSAGMGVDEFLQSPEEYKALLKQIKATDPSSLKRIGDPREPGNLYKVDLPDEQIAKMLDWDKPLSQQSAEVKAAFKLQDMGGTPAWDEITGLNLYNQLAGRLNVRNPSPMSGSEAASDFLKKAGIPGIRYLDQGSRPNTNSIAGIQANLDKAIARLKDWQGNTSSLGKSQRKMFSEQVASFRKILQDAQNNPATSNFVVFDPKNLKILERNKRAGGLALTRTSLRQRKPNQLAR